MFIQRAMFRGVAISAILSCGCAPAVPDPAADGERSPRLLGAPLEFLPTFTVIRAAMALPDGRLVISDARENRLTLLDPTSGAIRTLGRVGDGPGEFRRAGGLYRAPGGGIVMFDYDLRRLLPIFPSGELGKVVGLPTGGAAIAWSQYGPDPVMLDTLGRTYSAIRYGGFTAPTSVLLRFKPGAPPDTLTELRRPETRARGGASGRMEYQEVLFSPEDAWAVAPTGHIAIVRADPFRVEWLPPDGAPTIGPIIHYKRVAVVEAEKELIASGQAGPRGRTTVTIMKVPAGGGQSGGTPMVQPLSVDELSFAEEKAPVNVREGRRPLIDEAGRAWVPRNLSASADNTVFDVFDTRGQLQERVALPGVVRLVGFGRGSLFASRVDRDGVERLQRFALPF